MRTAWSSTRRGRWIESAAPAGRALIGDGSHSTGSDRLRRSPPVARIPGPAGRESSAPGLGLEGRESWTRGDGPCGAGADWRWLASTGSGRLRRSPPVARIPGPAGRESSAPGLGLEGRESWTRGDGPCGAGADWRWLASTGSDRLRRSPPVARVFGLPGRERWCAACAFHGFRSPVAASARGKGPWPSGPGAVVRGACAPRVPVAGGGLHPWQGSLALRAAMAGRERCILQTRGRPFPSPSPRRGGAPPDSAKLRRRPGDPPCRPNGQRTS